MNLTLWDTVVEGLRDRYRCIVPELPFGAHTAPMPDDADLSLPALATLLADFLLADFLLADFLTELDLHHVTLVCNDWGGAQLVPAPQQLLEWADQQRTFASPVLIVWAREDKLMPPPTPND